MASERSSSNQTPGGESEQQTRTMIDNDPQTSLLKTGSTRDSDLFDNNKADQASSSSSKLQSLNDTIKMSSQALVPLPPPPLPPLTQQTDSTTTGITSEARCDQQQSIFTPSFSNLVIPKTFNNNNTFLASSSSSSESSSPLKIDEQQKSSSSPQPQSQQQSTIQSTIPPGAYSSPSSSSSSPNRQSTQKQPPNNTNKYPLSSSISSSSSSASLAASLKSSNKTLNFNDCMSTGSRGSGGGKSGKKPSNVNKHRPSTASTSTTTSRQHHKSSHNNKQTQQRQSRHSASQHTSSSTMTVSSSSILATTSSNSLISQNKASENSSFTSQHNQLENDRRDDKVLTTKTTSKESGSSESTTTTNSAVTATITANSNTSLTTTSNTTASLSGSCNTINKDELKPKSTSGHYTHASLGGGTGSASFSVFTASGIKQQPITTQYKFINNNNNNSLSSGSARIASGNGGTTNQASSSLLGSSVSSRDSPPTFPPPPPPLIKRSSVHTSMFKHNQTDTELNSESRITCINNTSRLLSDDALSSVLAPSIQEDLAISSIKSSSVDLIEETKPVVNGIKVRAAKLSKLIDILIDSFDETSGQVVPDTDFPRVFLLMHKWFIQSETLANKLYDLYAASSSDNLDLSPSSTAATGQQTKSILTAETSTHSVTQLQKRICHCIRYWIQSYPFHFVVDTILIEAIKRFSTLLVSKGHDEQLKYFDISIVDSYDWMRKVTTKNPLKSREKISLAIHKMDPGVLASQITYLEWKTVRRISFSDYKAYAMKGAFHDNPSLAISFQLSNGLTRWVLGMVLNKHTPKQRAEVMHQFIVVAQHLRKLQNFNSLMAVMGGICHSTILRLSKTIMYLSSDDQRIISDFNELLSSNFNYVQYRRTTNEIQSFWIPIICIHLKDIIQLHTANPDILDNECINFRKMAQLSIIFQNITNLHNSVPPVQENRDIIKILQVLFDMNMKNYTDDELYELSLEREPRTSVSSPSTPSRISTIFSDFAKSISTPPDPQTIQKHVSDMVNVVFKNYDYDHDGFISQEEFDEISQSFPFIITFAVLDTDKNGMISREEMKNYFLKVNYHALKTEFKHNFDETTFMKPTFCAHCKGFLWGLIKQGYRCRDCGLNAHRHCKDSVVIECNRSKRDRHYSLSRQASQSGGEQQQQQSSTSGSSTMTKSSRVRSISTRSPIRESSGSSGVTGSSHHHYYHHHHHHHHAHHQRGSAPKVKQKATQTDNFDDLFLSDEEDEDDDEDDDDVDDADVEQEEQGGDDSLAAAPTDEANDEEDLDYNEHDADGDDNVDNVGDDQYDQASSNELCGDDLDEYNKSRGKKQQRRKKKDRGDAYYDDEGLRSETNDYEPEIEDYDEVAEHNQRSKLISGGSSKTAANTTTNNKSSNRNNRSQHNLSNTLDHNWHLDKSKTKNTNAAYTKFATSNNTKKSPKRRKSLPSGSAKPGQTQNQNTNNTNNNNHHNDEIFTIQYQQQQPALIPRGPLICNNNENPENWLISPFGTLKSSTRVTNPTTNNTTTNTTVSSSTSENVSSSDLGSAASTSTLVGSIGPGESNKAHTQGSTSSTTSSTAVKNPNKLTINTMLTSSLSSSLSPSPSPLLGSSSTTTVGTRMSTSMMLSNDKLFTDTNNATGSAVAAAAVVNLPSPSSVDAQSRLNTITTSSSNHSSSKSFNDQKSGNNAGNTTTSGGGGFFNKNKSYNNSSFVNNEPIPTTSQLPKLVARPPCASDNSSMMIAIMNDVTSYGTPFPALNFHYHPPNSNNNSSQTNSSNSSTTATVAAPAVTTSSSTQSTTHQSTLSSQMSLPVQTTSSNSSSVYGPTVKKKLIPRPVETTIVLKPSKLELNMRQQKKGSITLESRAATVGSSATVQSQASTVLATTQTTTATSTTTDEDDNDVFLRLKEAEKEREKLAKENEKIKQELESANAQIFSLREKMSSSSSLASNSTIITKVSGGGAANNSTNNDTTSQLVDSTISLYEGSTSHHHHDHHSLAATQSEQQLDHTAHEKLENQVNETLHLRTRGQSDA